MPSYTLQLDEGAPAGLTTIGKLYSVVNNRVTNCLRDVIVKPTIDALLDLTQGSYVYIFHVVGAGTFTLTLDDASGDEVDSDDYDTKSGNDHLPFNFSV